MRFPRQFHLHNHVYYHIVVFLLYILDGHLVHLVDIKIYCLDKQLLYNLTHHSRPHNRDIHHSENLLVCKVHWHIGIVQHDMVENLKTKTR